MKLLSRTQGRVKGGVRVKFAERKGDFLPEDSLSFIVTELICLAIGFVRQAD